MNNRIRFAEYIKRRQIDYRAAGFKGCPVFSLVTQEKISMNFLLHNRHEEITMERPDKKGTNVP